MTPNVLEICFQQTATFQKYTKIFQQNHDTQRFPSYVVFSITSQSLKFPQGFSSYFSKTVSQVPSRFPKSSFKQFLKLPQGLSGPSRSLRSLTVSQGHSGSLKPSKKISLSRSLTVSQRPSRSLRVLQNVKKKHQCLSWSLKVFQGPSKCRKGIMDKTLFSVSQGPSRSSWIEKMT